ncbi:MAG: hypothetical protein ACE37I_06425 [Rubinisphaera brasiliensis]|uniref:hypothetical protein n=1 Tax=Rubinisphaera TaxID=1649490 RepID=UPI001F34C953|nr:hypothetical protein [Rubinisphaera sp. JC750]MBR9801727.1 hypothetical protein [bacterium]
MSVRMMAAAMLMLLVCANLQAEEKKGKGKKGAAQRTPQALTLPASIELTADQEKQVKEIQAKHADKARELQKKSQELIPADVRKAQAAIMKEAREAGKTRKEIQEAVKAAQEELPAETREAMADVRKETQQLRQAFMKEVSEVLTDAQKELLPMRKGSGKKGGQGKKKKDA